MKWACEERIRKISLQTPPPKKNRPLGRKRSKRKDIIKNVKKIGM
jgi:hypothetical protein